MISYGKQSIDQSDIDSVVEVLGGDWLTQGPSVESFENNLKNYFGSQYCCAVSNGTAALHLAGLALGWKPGDIIITSPITFLASANAIVYSGATPDFVDISSDFYTIDVNLLEDKIKNYISDGKKVKGIIGVDFAGHPCDWASLRELADRYDLNLINDNCHALGASYKKDKMYAVKYADITTQSFHPVKHITTGEGGAILTNEKKYYEKIQLLRTHGMTKSEETIEKNDGPWYYEMHKLGYNYRITDFQCALGDSQLKKIDTFIEKRRKIATNYNEKLSNIEFLSLPQTRSDVEHAYHLYPLQINFDKIKLSKKDFFIKMREDQINLQVHYIPVHQQPFYREKYGFKMGDFPVSENFYLNEVSIPVYPSLGDADQERVVESIVHHVEL